ncbi:MAG: PqqD family protein [Chloroflexi bacterium]|nr:PqqD family protein [Chloroflexota bacterium]
MIDLNSKLVASSNQISTEMPNETVILDVVNGIYYGLDEVGTFIWNQVQSPQTVQSLVEALLDEYDVTVDQAQRDAVRLLSELQGIGLVHVVA